MDIITPSLADGIPAAVAESMVVVNEVMNSFPGFEMPLYEFRISHSSIGNSLLARVDDSVRASVAEILIQVKSSFTQKRTALVQLGLARSLVDEMEILSSQSEDVDDVVSRLTKAAGGLSFAVQASLQEIKITLRYAFALGFKRAFYVQPLNLHQQHFKDGVMFEVIKGKRRSDVLAASGRYDHLFKGFSFPTATKQASVRAVGVQIALDKICVALAHFQGQSARSLMKDQRSFGYWAPRRCDIYIISHQPGQELERFELAALCWSSGISADVMYESSVEDGAEALHDLCMKEGILFTVFPRPRSSRLGYKVIATLSRTEYEVSKSELIAFLLQNLTEQRKIDMATSGVIATTQPQGSHGKDHALAEDVQLILPPDRKQLKNSRKIILDKAYEIVTTFQHAFRRGIPVVAVQVSPLSFSAMTEGLAWLADEEPEALKRVTSTFVPPTSYALQIREAILKRRSEGHRFVILVSIRDEKLHLLALPPY